MIAYSPFVSVIIPIYHDWDRLQLCIDGLRKQTYPKDLFEVIIINNDPGDHPKNLHLLENSSLLSESKPGSYAARNTGIAVAKGEILAFTDSDCIPTPKWLENGVFEISQGIDRVAGKVELFYNYEKLTFAEIFEKAFAFPQEGYVKSGRSCITANLITTADAFNKVGLFNSFLLSGGDMEWGWRARNLGLSIIYSPETIVFHPARCTIREIIQKNMRVIGGLSGIYKKDDPRNRWFIAALLPPLNKILIVRKRGDMTMGMKIIAIALAYLFELHKCGYWIALKIGIVTPVRE